MHVQKVKEQEKAYNKQVRVFHSFIYLFLINICHWLLYWQDKTRQDNVLCGVLYSPMYIDFIQII